MWTHMHTSTYVASGALDDGEDVILAAVGVGGVRSGRGRRYRDLGTGGARVALLLLLLAGLLLDRLEPRVSGVRGVHPALVVHVLELQKGLPSWARGIRC